jgi:hypothetical protein
MKLESCEKTADMAQASHVRSTSMHSPVITFQTRTDSSYELVRILVESWEKSTEETTPTCPPNVCSRCPFSESQMFTVMSLEAEAMSLES